MSLRALTRNALWSAIAHLLGRGSLVVAAILLARSLDTREFAAYSFFQLTVSMLAAYAAMGLGVTASRFFAECGHVDDDRLPPIGTLWILSLLAGLLFAFVVLLLPDAWLDGGLGVPRWLLALGLFSMAIGVVPGGGVLGLERYAAAIVAAGMSAVVLIVGAVAAGKAGSATGAMAVFVVANLIQSVGNALVVLREVGWRTLARHARMGRTEMARVAGFAGPMLGVSLLAASGTWVVGRIILAGPAGEHGFALYAIGLQWYALALFLPGMVSRVLLPRLVRARVGGCVTDSRMLVRQGAFAAVIAASVVSFGAGAFSPWLLKLYGAAYQVDGWLLGAFLLAAIPNAPVNTVSNAIIALDGQRTWLYVTAVWFVLVATTAVVFQGQGAWGGAWALGLSSVGLATLAVGVGRRWQLV